MRLLFVTHNIPRYAGDAAGSFVLRLAAALQHDGHRVHVIAPGAPGLASHDTLDGVTVERVRYGPDASMTLAYTGAMAEEVRGSWRARIALVGLLRALRGATKRQLHDAARAGDPFDVVHAHWWFPAALALWRALPRTTPLVITMHGSDVRLAQGIAPARRIMRAVLGMASVRTAVSTWLADAASRIAPEGRVHVAPMPVATARFTPPAPDASREGVLLVGRLNAQKGVADLLRALAAPRLARARARIVGDGPDRDALRRLAESLGVAARVEWLGAVAHDALAELYRHAAVVAMPSTEEGLGLVAVEAQLCETPVVAYASGGLPDVVRIDCGGTLVRAGDVAAFAEAIARLLEDPVAARAAGRDARRAMIAVFAPEQVAERYAAFYREAIDGARHPGTFNASDVVRS